MEAINLDLESRLEAQAREYIELESDAVDSHGPECFSLYILMQRDLR